MKFRLYLASVFTFIASFFYSQSLSVLYFTDAHEIAPFPYSKGTKGGVARFKTVVEELKSQKKDVIVTFGGDLAGGTLFGKVYKGFPMVEALNEIPIDIANFGQHEFDFGVENARKLVSQSKFQWFSSNLTNLKGEPLYKLPQYIIKEKNGIKVGFVGLTDNLDTSAQGEDILQQDMISSAKKGVLELKKKGVDYIIAITQTSIPENRKILEAVPDINLIFTEEVSEETTEIISFEDKYIISTIGYMGSVAEVELNRKQDKIDANIRIHFLGDKVKPNSKLEKLSDKYMKEMERSLSQVVAVAQNDFSIEGHSQRQQENVLGNLIADAYRNYFLADIAFMNGGGIRSGLHKGNVTKKDVFAVLPFDNKVCLAEISGKKIKEMISQGLLNWEKFGGEFLQVSGLNYSFKVSKNGKADLLDVMFKGNSIDENKKYKVAMPNYVLLGGGAFDEVSEKEILIKTSDAPVDSDVLLRYIEGNKDLKVILDRRIIIIK